MGGMEFAFDYDPDPPAIGEGLAGCWHSAKERLDASVLSPAVSIDHWSELLDPPLENGIVRAFNNELARLCLATVAVQKRFNVHIVPKKPCWICDHAMCFTADQHVARRRSGMSLSETGVKDYERHHIFIC